MSDSAQSGAGRREIAYRLFAAEYEAADLSYSESDEERAPNYVVTPSGARVNRLFVVGVLTEVEQVSEDVLRGRVVDPTGAFVLYAGQYQPDEMAFLEAADPPTFAAVTGKARTFQPDDSERVFTSIRPETINEVDAATRDRWTVQAAEHTLDRIARMAAALARDERGDDLRAALREGSVDEGLAAGIPVAIDHYGTTPTYLAALRGAALDAARVVAGTTDEVDPLDVPPDASGDAGLSTLQDSGVDVGRVTDTSAEEAGDDEATTSAGDDEAAGPPEPAETAESRDSGGSPEAAPEASAAAESGGEGASTGAGVEGVDDAASSDSGVDDAASSDSGVDDAVSSDSGVDDTASSDSGGGDLGDFDPAEYELEEETREQVEEEYGTEFQTGAEVDEPGAAGVEPAAPDTDVGSADAEPAAEPASPEATSGSADETPADSPGTEHADDSPGTEHADDSPETEHADDSPETEHAEEAEEAVEEPEDLQAAVVDLMNELDDGSGADREALIAAATQRYGTGADEVEDAIQGALMDGQCYEPDETTLTPI